MRQVTHVIVIIGWFSWVGLSGSSQAFATPFEPSTVPAHVEAIGHLDVDALRHTQIFALLGGDKAIETAIGEHRLVRKSLSGLADLAKDQAADPTDLRQIARSIAASARGITFWYENDHGAVYLQTRDAHALAALVAQARFARVGAVDGIPTYANKDPEFDSGFVAPVGDTLVLADTTDSLERSIHVLTGRGASLAGTTALPSATRSDIFVFVTIGRDALSTIQKSARAKILQLPIKSLVIYVGESSGVVTAAARAEMGSADALQKAKGIVEGLHALASFSDDASARALLDHVTIAASGLALDVVVSVPVTDLASAIESKE